MFLIVVEAHSKWPEVIMMSSTTSTKTIEVLQALFARYGQPEQLVSHNGPQFVSQEFQHFMQQNSIRHVRSAPYHPSTNGLAERFVQTFKNAMKASENDGESLDIRMTRFLGNYRSTPHTTTGISPSELFLRRKVRTKFDMLRPDVQGVVDTKKSLQKKYHDSHAKLRLFTPGQAVMARDYLSSKKWVPGVIQSSSGPTLYKVQLNNGNVVVRHIDQLRDRLPTLSPSDQGHSADRFKFLILDVTLPLLHHRLLKLSKILRHPLPRYPRCEQQPVDRLMKLQI